MADKYEIRHGISRGFDGSAYSQSNSDSHYVMTTLTGPSNLNKANNCTGIEVKLKLALDSTTKENLNLVEFRIAYYIKKILTTFIVTGRRKTRQEDPPTC